MPVWHGLTKELVERGELVVIGITQEQHPDRCALFARWKGLDFPILWDPFNLTMNKDAKVTVSLWGYLEDTITPQLIHIDDIERTTPNDGIVSGSADKSHRLFHIICFS